MSKQKENTEKAATEVANASQAIKRGDWKAALTSIATGIQLDPFNTELTTLIDRAIDTGGDDASAFLKKESHQPYLGFEALKAYAAHRAGDHKAAFSTLDNLTRNFPESLFAEAWGFDWLTDQAILVAGLDSLRFLASSVHNRYPEAEQSTDWCRAQLARAIVGLERIEATLGETDQTVLFKGQMLSKSGRFQEAIAMAVKAAETNPTFRTATAAAMAHKRAGDIEGAVQWFWRASELDPENETGLLDIGDTYAGMGEWKKSLAAYEAALKRVPNHDWAYPSAVYCRYRISNDPALLEELRYMANAAPDECGMAGMMKQMFGGYNFEDRRHRATDLMREIDPKFEPTPRPHEHDHDEDEEVDGEETQ